MNASATPSFVIRNIGECLTLDPKAGQGPLGKMEKAAFAVSGSMIAWVGPEKEIPKKYLGGESIDAEGALVSPGLIDCHTHLMFAGSRADEFFARLQGETYESIAKKGGGIRRTVTSTSEASDEELLASAAERMSRFSSYGVTTVEIKSGYGLSVKAELRILRLIQKIKHGVDVIPTFLGAHVVPAEYKNDRREYIRQVTEEMLPVVAREKLAGICDVFCEEGAYSPDESREILTAAKKLGLKLKLHADQLTCTHAAELAAELGAVSADHLEQVSEAGIRAMAARKIVGVLLPGAVFFLGKRTYPPARKLLDAGVNVALSTDCNPGTSYSENLPLMMTLAAVEMKMTNEEIWPAVTKNAAAAIGCTDRGVLAPGLRADLTIWDAQHSEDVIYHFGATQARRVFFSGFERRSFPK